MASSRRRRLRSGVHVVVALSLFAQVLLGAPTPVAADAGTHWIGTEPPQAEKVEATFPLSVATGQQYEGTANVLCNTWVHAPTATAPWPQLASLHYNYTEAPDPAVGGRSDFGGTNNNLIAQLPNAGGVASALVQDIKCVFDGPSGGKLKYVQIAYGDEGPTTSYSHIYDLGRGSYNPMQGRWAADLIEEDVDAQGRGYVHMRSLIGPNYDIGHTSCPNGTGSSAVMFVSVMNDLSGCDEFEWTWGNISDSWDGVQQQRIAGFDIEGGSQSAWTGKVKHERIYLGAGAEEQFDYPNTVPVGVDPPGPTPAAADTFPPRLACGRTLRDLGGGQWVADVEAFVRNPSTDPTVTDSQGYWRASWEAGVTYPGKRKSVPLPVGATSSDSLYMTFVMTRTIKTLVGWEPGTPEPGQWVDTANPSSPPGGIEAWLDPTDMSGWIWVGRAAREDIASVITGEDRHSSGYMFDTDGDGDGDQLTQSASPSKPIYEVVTLKAYCTMSVSPVTMVEDGGPSVIVVVDIPPHPDDPDDTDAPPPPTTGGGSGCSSSDGGIVGIISDALSALKCVIDLLADILSGLLDGVASAIGELLSWLQDHLGAPDLGFVGDLVGEWETKFPLSVLGEAGDALGALTGALDHGMDNACGPTIDPDLDGKLELPGAGTDAKLDALKVSLPSPNDCPNQSDAARDLADLQGMRVPIRSFLTLALYAGFFVRVASSFGPKRTGLEADAVAQ